MSPGCGRGCVSVAQGGFIPAQVNKRNPNQLVADGTGVRALPAAPSREALLQLG